MKEHFQLTATKPATYKTAKAKPHTNILHKH